MKEVIDYLFCNTDDSYKKFHSNLVSNTKYEILGVKTPLLKKFAKELALNNEKAYSFINEKHVYYEEVAIHSFVIANLKVPIKEKIKLIKKFIPQIDNWAICDGFVSSLKIFKNEQQLAYNLFCNYIISKETYIKRFAVVLALDYLLNKVYTSMVLDDILQIKSNEYYVNMAISWFICELVIKDYDKGVSVLKSKTLPPFVQNKAISKINDSYRITKENKLYLKTFKI